MVCRSVDDIDWRQWAPRMKATLLFVVRGGKILLIHKKLGLGTGKINGVGGRLEEGETPVRAAVREVQEELHIVPVNPKEIGRLSFQFLDGLSLWVTVFRASAYRGTPTETEEAIPLWFDIDAIPYNRMWEDDIFWMPLMLQGAAFDGYFIFDGDRMLDAAIETPVDPSRSAGYPIALDSGI